MTELSNLPAAGSWVVYWSDREHFTLDGIFASLPAAYEAMVDFYEPKNLKIKSYSWSNELVEVRVFGKDIDDETELDMQFFIEYMELGVFRA